jgi:hypothetical protein
MISHVRDTAQLDALGGSRLTVDLEANGGPGWIVHSDVATSRVFWDRDDGVFFRFFGDVVVCRDGGFVVVIEGGEGGRVAGHEGAVIWVVGRWLGACGECAKVREVTGESVGILVMGCLWLWWVGRGSRGLGGAGRIICNGMRRDVAYIRVPGRWNMRESRRCSRCRSITVSSCPTRGEKGLRGCYPSSTILYRRTGFIASWRN